MVQARRLTYLSSFSLPPPMHLVRMPCPLPHWSRDSAQPYSPSCPARVSPHSLTTNSKLQAGYRDSRQGVLGCRRPVLCRQRSRQRVCPARFPISIPLSSASLNPIIDYQDGVRSASTASPPTSYRRGARDKTRLSAAAQAMRAIGRAQEGKRHELEGSSVCLCRRKTGVGNTSCTQAGLLSGTGRGEAGSATSSTFEEFCEVGGLGFLVAEGGNRKRKEALVVRCLYRAFFSAAAGLFKIGRAHV